MVHSFQAIDHLHNTWLFLAEALRVLKPGGTALISSENLTSFLNTGAMMMGYTPFTLISGQGLALTAGLWGAALLGVGLKVADPVRFRWPGLALYLGMGWAGVLAGRALLAALPGPVVALMILGGGLYTVGVVFYLWERLPYHNTIWHVFVLTASMVFFAAVTVLVVGG